MAHHRQKESHNLADDGSHRSTGHPHGRDAQPTKDEQGVQHNVQNSPHALGNHGVQGPACSLQQAFKEDLSENSEGEQRADLQILHASSQNLRNVRLNPEKHACTKCAKQHKQQAANSGEHQAIAGSQVSSVIFPAPQTFGEKRVHAHAYAGGKSDHQVLNWKGHGDGSQSIFTDPGDIHTVHHIVQRLDQHGNHHGKGHVRQEPAHRHGPHFVFCAKFCFHCSTSQSKVKYGRNEAPLPRGSRRKATHWPHMQRKSTPASKHVWRQGRFHAKVRAHRAGQTALASGILFCSV